MQTDVQIILIVALAIVLLAALILNRGKLKRLGVKASNKGFEVDAQMTDGNSKPDESSPKKKAVVEQVHQEGNRDKIAATGEDVTLRDVEQKGDDNSINIG